MDGLQSSVRQLDFPMTCSLCIKMMVGESGRPRLADLCISLTAGLFPNWRRKRRFTSSLGTRRVTSGFQKNTVSGTCGRGVWSSRSPGQRWGATKMLR